MRDDDTGPLPINPCINGRAAVITHAELPTPEDLRELGLTRVRPDPEERDRRKGRVPRGIDSSTEFFD